MMSRLRHDVHGSLAVPRFPQLLDRRMSTIDVHPVVVTVCAVNTDRPNQTIYLEITHT